MNILEIKNLSLKILDKKILKNINFELKEKEIISIIGKSGSGKTMLSNMIMGLKNKNMQIDGNILFKISSAFSKFTCFRFFLASSITSFFEIFL